MINTLLLLKSNNIYNQKFKISETDIKRIEELKKRKKQIEKGDIILFPNKIIAKVSDYLFGEVFYIENPPFFPAFYYNELDFFTSNKRGAVFSKELYFKEKRKEFFLIYGENGEKFSQTICFSKEVFVWEKR